MRRVKSYGYEVRANARLRVWLEADEQDLVAFAVSLECEVAPNDWRAVARYDTTGGKVHRDRLKPDGSYLTHRESARLGSTLDQALDAAQDELAARADIYITRFLQMLESEKDGDEAAT